MAHTYAGWESGVWQQTGESETVSGNAVRGHLLMPGVFGRMGYAVSGGFTVSLSTPAQLRLINVRAYLRDLDSLPAIEVLLL